MMPTIAASTGAPFLPSASPAARPSITTSTFSSTPAPTPSIASSALPRGVSSAFRGWTSSNFAPSNLGCFCVATTVPTTRAICMSLRPLRSFAAFALSQVPVVDDPDDARVDRGLGGIERKAGFPAAHEEHLLADARADGVHRDERPARRLAIGGERLHDEQLDAREALVLPRRDDVADHSRQ